MPRARRRANRAKDYLVNTRGIDAGRLVVVDGGCMPELKVELWDRPSGATPPAASTGWRGLALSDCKKKPTRRRGAAGEARMLRASSFFVCRGTEQRSPLKNGRDLLSKAGGVFRKGKHRLLRFFGTKRP